MDTFTGCGLAGAIVFGAVVMGGPPEYWLAGGLVVAVIAALSVVMGD